jgi:hypothetical protein
VKLPRTRKSRLLRRIAKQKNGCWIWTGARTRNGHGTLWLSGKATYVHRLAYELWVGPIPQGRGVYHHCGNRTCCNPDHLCTSKDTARLEQRLLRKIEKQENGCWIWQGNTNNGYGCIEVAGHRRAVHRVAYELWIEPIPEGLQIQHLCNDRLCINPVHLVVGTASENARHMIDLKRCRNECHSEA